MKTIPCGHRGRPLNVSRENVVFPTALLCRAMGRGRGKRASGPLLGGLQCGDGGVEGDEPEVEIFANVNGAGSGRMDFGGGSDTNSSCGSSRSDGKKKEDDSVKGEGRYTAVLAAESKTMTNEKSPTKRTSGKQGKDLPVEETRKDAIKTKKEQPTIDGISIKTKIKEARISVYAWNTKSY